MRRFPLLAAAASLAFGCGTLSELGGGGLRVERVAERAGYLDVSLVGSGIAMRSFTAADGVCRRVLERDRKVGYLERGIGGRFTRGDERCDAIGIGDPRLRRSNRPRGGGNRPIPRGQASFRTIYEDADVLMLRGRFPLTDRVGWSGGRDSVAVVANSDRCRTATASGTASIEFRPTGANTLALVARDGLCRIEGLILPLPETPYLGRRERREARTT